MLDIMNGYRVVAADIDGTLLRDDKSLSLAVREALEGASLRGITVVVATGRPAFGALPVAKGLGADFLISYGGGRVENLSTGEMVSELMVSPTLAGELYEIASQAGLAIETFREDTALTESADNPYIRRQARINRLSVRHVDSFVEAACLPMPKCMIVGVPEKVEMVERDVLKVFEGRLNVCRSEPFFLELTAPGADKGNALARLAEHEGWSLDEVVALGDGYNDIPMIQRAGLGCAMGNASDVVKASADLVLKSNEEDGAAVLINQL